MASEFEALLARATNREIREVLGVIAAVVDREGDSLCLQRLIS
jgi:hypothetical protein